MNQMKDPGSAEDPYSRCGSSKTGCLHRKPDGSREDVASRPV
jgi:hypothetical protein